MYMQAQHSLYNPVLMQIPMLIRNIEVSYIELLDESCVEFPHTHNEYEIYYCLSGSMKNRVEGKVHTLKEREFLFLSPGLVHGSIYQPYNPKKYFVIVFSFPESVEAQLDASFEKDFVKQYNHLFNQEKYFVAQDNFNANRAIAKMQTELENKMFGWEISLRNYYLEFIIAILRNLIEISGDNDKVSDNINMAIKITKFMHNNYSNDIKVKDVAEHMHISTRHVNRVFQSYFGESFSKTLNLYRLNYAKNYLLDTDKSIEDIAIMVGFSTAQPLFRLFREQEGMTANEYREMYKEK